MMECAVVAEVCAEARVHPRQGSTSWEAAQLAAFPEIQRLVNRRCELGLTPGAWSLAACPTSAQAHLSQGIQGLSMLCPTAMLVLLSPVLPYLLLLYLLRPILLTKYTCYPRFTEAS